MSITSFQGEHRFLSNFYPAEVEILGVTYPTVEHAYQAMKSSDNVYRAAILACRTPGEAKRLGKTCRLGHDWETSKVRIMRALVAQKFFSHEDLERKLLATGNQLLQEGNYWGDTFWGVDLKTGRGSNHLGRILMEVRAALRER